MGEPAEKELIVTCGCGDTDKFATDAFKILFPTKERPPLQHGFRPEDSSISINVNDTKRYAYYLHGGEEVWDLLKGVRVI